jgi:hypothetical protein
MVKKSKIMSGGSFISGISIITFLEDSDALAHVKYLLNACFSEETRELSLLPKIKSTHEVDPRYLSITP